MNMSPVFFLHHFHDMGFHVSDSQLLRDEALHLKCAFGMIAGADVETVAAFAAGTHKPLSNIQYLGALKRRGNVGVVFRSGVGYPELENQKSHEHASANQRRRITSGQRFRLFSGLTL